VVRGLIYDFDDTIVESERINDELFSALLRDEYRIDLSREELDFLYGFAWSGVFDWLKEHRNLAPSRAEVWKRFMEIKRATFAGRTLRTATGIELMLALPVPQAIVSGSTREELRMMMANIGMREDAVAFILSDEDCRRGKPDPQGYLMALERLGTAPGETIVFEDSPAGIEAAHRAGTPVVFVAELASRDSGSRAEVRFATFRDAWAAIRPRIPARQ
jgi:beta-phosphoglucomutase-like phosphatase (HAD superfamily)